MTNTTLVLIYLVPVSLCYNYLFIYDLLSSIQRQPLVLKIKRCLNIWGTHPLAFRKNISIEHFAKIPQKTILESLIQVHLQVF